MLQLQEINRRFGDTVVAADINLTVAAGEVMVLLGPSGCGKSTLLHMVAGLLAPDSGRVWFGGEDYTFRQPETRRFGLMFQDFALFPHLNVLENVMFGLRAQGWRKAAAQQAATAMLDGVALSPQAQQKVWTLSGGQQQRVALARVLVTEPQLLLLDEPFSGLDAHLRAQIQGDTVALIRRRQLPVLWVTHDRQEAFAHADRVAVMSRGRIEQVGIAEALLQAPNSPEVARLLGCLNVFEDCYVPQQALQLHRDGTRQAVTAVQRLPECLRLTFAWQDRPLQLDVSVREAEQWLATAADGSLSVPVTVLTDKIHVFGNQSRPDSV